MWAEVSSAVPQPHKGPGEILRGGVQAGGRVTSSGWPVICFDGKNVGEVRL